MAYKNFPQLIIISKNKIVYSFQLNDPSFAIL
jgi:hypothetical protein